ncbi:MAG: hypothetical protein ACXVJZ_01400 [Acidimicrobiia bacterium]
MQLTHPTAHRLLRSPLEVAAAVFAVALVVHGADHLRRGMHVLTPEVQWLGNVQIALSVVTLVLVFRRHRWAPVFAVGIGFASAVGFTAAHLLPHWSAFSDAFTGAHPAPHVNAFSWFAAVFEITAGLALGIAGVAAIRSRSSAGRTTS